MTMNQFGGIKRGCSKSSILNDYPQSKNKEWRVVYKPEYV